MLKRCGKLGFLNKVDSLYDCYFKSYTNRKDESNQRQAAKNSYVGSGHAIAGRGAKYVGKGGNDDKAEVLLLLLATGLFL